MTVATQSIAHRLPASMCVFERGWLSANNVLFVDGDDTALVDSGYVTHATQTLSLVEAALGGRPLGRLINTHLHSDHCGGNALLQRRWHPRTWIPAAEAGAVARWDVDALSYRATGQQCDPFVFDALLEDGQTLSLGGIDWQVIAAPGHDPHAVMLYAAQPRILISGDALWQHGFGVIFPELDGDSGFAEQQAVLERIAQLDVDLVIPGHGSPFTDVGSALERASGRLAYLRDDPRRNASHALRVLVKFKLLEQRRIDRGALLQWMADAPLMARVRSRYFPELSQPAMLDDVLAGLVKARAATVDGDIVCNHD
ncbi:glyoxylase-like metal-dependent hydrolase (beta-lactamase superfamily II) [Cupriavidus gilardii J11]|uniref:Glyoxylase-like metal-dependent hydrolase (Beta-lactamase superfamily II) n=1 Tax=Cupriavidus gilardii J11 TaxID=936133 RepID=A0A562BAN5_9BURK|nr:MBL fold metallo-hydrolase [Cupriavidus gilardii]TWG82252.1 glyoxylase-like metal-dependent hydrolase (beta-lactamase superfamily II) [Cupriavidus gilardii J11]